MVLLKQSRLQPAVGIVLFYAKYGDLITNHYTYT